MSDNWTDRLSEYIDGELPQGELVELEQHLANCTECATLVTDLRRVAERSRSLPQRAPATDLWPGIAARRGAAPGVRGGLLRRVRPDASRISFSLPQLVAAAVTVAVIAGAAVWLGLRVFTGAAPTRPAPEGRLIAQAAPKPVETPHHVLASAPIATAPLSAASSDSSLSDLRRATAHYDAAIAELEKALRRHQRQLSPRTREAIAASLLSLDNASSQAKLALQKDPTDVYLYTHLDNTLRRKMQLLRRANSIGASSQI